MWSDVLSQYSSCFLVPGSSGSLWCCLALYLIPYQRYLLYVYSIHRLYQVIYWTFTRRASLYLVSQGDGGSLLLSGYFPRAGCLTFIYFMYRMKWHYVKLLLLVHPCTQCARVVEAPWSPCTPRAWKAVEPSANYKKLYSDIMLKSCSSSLRVPSAFGSWRCYAALQLILV